MRLLTLTFLIVSLPLFAYRDDGEIFDHSIPKIDDGLYPEDREESGYYNSKGLGHELLMVVQTISNSRKTMVLRIGRKSNVRPGMESLVSTDKVSIRVTAVEVGRRYSLWRVSDPAANLPFSRGEFIIYSSSLETITNNVPSLKSRLTSEIKRRKKVYPSYWAIRGSGSFAPFSTISDIPSDGINGRFGLQAEITYYRNLARRIDWGLGLRGDLEVALIDEPVNLQVPTIRGFVTFDMLYYFPMLESATTQFYGGLGMGVGPSVTSVDGNNSIGFALCLPAVRLGFSTQMTSSMKLLLEGVAEGVIMQESFDNGDDQSTSVANLKLTIGLTF